MEHAGYHRYIGGEWVGEDCPACRNKERRVTKVEFLRYTKYEVMKLDDIDQCLLPYERRWLNTIIKTIQDGREAEGKARCNRYVVVNEDEPYVEQVWALIREQWERDQVNEKPPCPIKLQPVHCVGCEYVKEGLCDYPNSRNEPFGNVKPLLPGTIMDIGSLSRLEKMAYARDQARNDLETVLMVADIPKKVA